MFWDLIYELAADRGMTVLVTTHYMDEAEQCDRLAFILDGELIADGSPLELKSHLAGRLFEVVVEHDAFGALETLRSQQQFEDVYLAGRHLRAVLRAEAQGRGACTARRHRPARIRRAVPRGCLRLAGPQAHDELEGGCMRRLLALTWKEFMQLKRDRLTLRMIILVPLMQTLVFGYAINYDVKHLRTVVLDESRSYDSRELVARLTASQYFDVVGRVDSLRELQTALDSATASVGLVIDREYGANRHRGKPAEAFIVVNASDTTTATQAMSIANGVATQLSIQTLARRAGWRETALPVDLRLRPWYNPDLRTATFVIPGLLAIILTFTLIQFTAGAIVRERELGTLEQLQVTPVTRTQLILGKLVPFIVIGYVQLTRDGAADALPLRHPDHGQRAAALCGGVPVHCRGAGARHAALDDRADAAAGAADSR